MRNKLRLATVLVGLSLLLAGCDNNPAPTDIILKGKTMGTVWRVTLSGVSAKQGAQLNSLIQAQLDADDHEFSTWKQDSRLSLFNRSTSLAPQPISYGMAAMISSALRVGRLTAGAMDITVGPLVNLWGFGPQSMPTHTPTPAQINAAKAEVGLQHLTLIENSQGTYLQKNIANLSVDLSTVGEGYAADHLARLMEQQGVRNYLVSVGGALISRGSHQQGSAWRVAVQQPTDLQNRAQIVVDLQGHGISTSGDYRNYYELDGKRISHIIDPTTGHPIDHHLVSATVIATSALEADAWDTGLMVLGTEKAKAIALKQHLAVYLITREQGKFVGWASPTFTTFLSKSQQ